MKCISLYQPWASAVALRLKKLEIRSWGTDYRGPILIHASKQWTGAQRAFWASSAERLPDLGVHPVDVRAYSERPLLGHVIARADLVECRPTDDILSMVGLTGLEILFGDFNPGRWIWQLKNVVRLPEPVPCRGARGIWCPSSAAIDLVEAQCQLS